ncbi:uncharacterized protein N7484_004044 [Penicillium longicatenatum]|uniref:uncharacterized protein n=1 Tax=Penicillium longicatenatum TaxID=1561947 RepID=UPI0025484281|nr:uncharacterized protein N7484_004044 [Penicillium longicatenatum]KAJ5650321.1 hypothetical protein N7484_004044 [Penicillium longicatenatum]
MAQPKVHSTLIIDQAALETQGASLRLYRESIRKWQMSVAHIDNSDGTVDHAMAKNPGSPPYQPRSALNFGT